MPTKIKSLLIITVCVFGYANASGQDVSAKLDEFLNAYAKQYKFNGTALVSKKGTVLLKKGYGMKNDSLHIPNDENTIYQVGSITKQFTSTVIMKLQEQNKLSVKDKLSKYFPEFPNADKISIENLLTHTSGIYSYTNDQSFMVNEIMKPHNRQSMIALFSKKPLDFEPGLQWNYSNSGYLMLGYIIEDITGKPYEQVMREMIFTPLQMNHSGFDFTHLKSADKATGYMIYNDNAKIAAPIVDSSVSFSAGALYTTVGDLYKWERAVSGNQILRKDSWTKAMTPSKNHYGYGWFSDTLYNKQVISHGGGIHGFNSNMFRIPQEDIAIILLNNKNNSFLDTITKGIAAILLNEKYQIPTARVQITVADSVLKKYVGEYELAPTFKITVTFENGNLKGQATGQPAFDMYPEKQNLFFLKLVDAQVEFVRAPDGSIEKLVLYQNGKIIPGRKIKE